MDGEFLWYNSDLVKALEKVLIVVYNCDLVKALEMVLIVVYNWPAEIFLS